jgi:hypothetical protein
MRSSLKLPGTTHTDIMFNDQSEQTTGLGFCGSFENRSDSSNPGVGVSKLITFSDPLVVDKGITLDITRSEITFTTPGTYFMTSQFSFIDTYAQGSSNVWYTLNNSPVLAVATTFAFYDGLNNPQVCLLNGSLQDIITVPSTGSSIKFYWQPNSTTMTLEARDASALVPQKPSAKVSVYKVA